VLLMLYGGVQEAPVHVCVREKEREREREREREYVCVECVCGVRVFVCAWTHRVSPYIPASQHVDAYTHYTHYTHTHTHIHTHDSHMHESSHAVRRMNASTRWEWRHARLTPDMHQPEP